MNMITQNSSDMHVVILKKKILQYGDKPARKEHKNEKKKGLEENQEQRYTR